MSPHSRASSNSSDLPMVETAQRARAESLIAEEESLKHKEAQSSTLSLHPAFYILSWIFFSNFTILFNKWLIDNAGFPYRTYLLSPLGVNRWKLGNELDVCLGGFDHFY
ncbi:hypothetical protein V2G26_003282 [Clonostachys chloroleuca]